MTTTKQGKLIGYYGMGSRGVATVVEVPGKVREIRRYWKRLDSDLLDDSAKDRLISELDKLGAVRWSN